MRFVILPYWSAQRGLANVSDLSAWARTGMHIIVSIIQASLLGGRMSFDIVSVCSCCSFVLSVRVVHSCCVVPSSCSFVFERISLASQMPLSGHCSCIISCAILDPLIYGFQQQAREHGAGLGRWF
jgi:hypothetical protein